MSQKVQELLAEGLAIGFPGATITEKDNTFKLHVSEITTEQFIGLGKLAVPCSSITAKRSGTGITIIVTV